MAKGSYKLSIPNQTTNLKVIRDFIEDIAERAGFEGGAIDEIALAVDEASTNVIKHAYKGNGDQDIEIEVKFDKTKLIVSITDSGKGFDPEAVGNVNVKEYVQAMKPGGLGIHLMKKMMDEVTYDIQPGISNCCKLVKYFPEE